MEYRNDQLKIEYLETNVQPIYVKLLSVFLILIFAVTPLAEIVSDIDYNRISYHNSTTFCIGDIDYQDNILSFKEIK